VKPLRLTARGYRSFADLDYTFQDGATAVVGSNGAGKSTLIGAVEIALFGPRSRSLEPLVREGSDDMSLCLELEHGGETYRVRRGWKSGRSTLDLERFELAWQPLSQGSAADTQILLESIVGLNRTTFLASGYLAQRQSDSFTGAQPKDRKRILSDALALDAWQTDAERVGADRRKAERALAEIDGKVDGLAERAAAADTLTTEAGDLRLLVDIETASETEARTAAETEAARAADLDAQATAGTLAIAAADTARAKHTAHAARLIEAQVARERLDGERTSLSGLVRLDEERSELTAKREALASQDAARAEALRIRDDRLADDASLYATLARAAKITADQEAEAARLTAALAAIVDGTVSHCDRCQQELPDTAREAAAASLRRDIDEHTGIRSRHLDDVVDVERKRATLTETMHLIIVPAEAEGLTDVAARLTDLESVPVDIATVRERIAGLEATIAQTGSDEYRETARLLSFERTEAEQALASIAQPEPGAADHARAAALQAKTQADAHAARARQAAERLAAVTALLEQAQAALVEHQAAVLERDRLHADLDILVRLEQAFGRDGIPAWIVESQALPQIESEANRILSRLGGAISRVELRTERETKSGDKRDALDIVCLTEDGERALETFSGGEQSRAEIALALGLVDVLQSRRDADLRYLALDEPSGLDGQGTEALAEILRERSAGTVVLLASHDANLRDQFDASITVERGPAGSRVVA
jgi:DNA repair exonuclease SbcCD ATPase subunit